MLFGSWCICSLGYSLVQILFWQLMYLQYLDIYCCRCSFGDQRICDLLFFELADAFQPAWHVNCICILLFLGFKDTSFANFASASHVFDNVRMLLIEILHPQPALSKPCGYFTAWGNTLLTKNWYKKFERLWSERWWHLERKFLCYWIWTNMFEAT